MILREGFPIRLVDVALALWAFIQVADAYDSCDVRHRFMPETRKYYAFSDLLFRVGLLFQAKISRTKESILLFSECRNKLGDSKCDRLAALGQCVGEHYEDMFIQCKRSCGFCSEYKIHYNFWYESFKNLCSLD